MNKPRHHANWERTFLLGVKIDAVSVDQLLSEIRACIQDGRKTMISNVNIHAMNLSYENSWFRILLNQSHLTFCDGVGVKLAARMTGQYLKDRFTPPDFVDRICEAAVISDWKIFFLGAKPGVAQRAAKQLLDKYPGLQIRTHHGFFDKSIEGGENQAVTEQINGFCPQILVVGFGMPLQERWILDNLQNLDIQVAFPAGALFDYLSKELPRAPRWMTDHGLEWLGRLVVEPRRLWKRYLVGNPLFFWRVFLHHFLGFPLPE